MLLDSVSPEPTAIELAKIPQLTSTSATIGWPTVTAMAWPRIVARPATSSPRYAPSTASIDVDLHELVDVHFYRNHFVRIPAMSIRESGDYSSLDRPASTQTIR